MYEYKFEEEEEEEEVQQPEKIKLGDVEYTSEELQGLIDDGKFKRDVEEKQNTKLDKVFSEYTKLTQASQKWQEERDDYIRLKAEHDAKQQQPQQQEFTPEQIAEARKQAKGIGLLTEDVLDEYFTKKFPTFYVQQRTADKTLEKMEGLAKEIDGSDGRPKFDIDEMLDYRQRTGIADPLSAYKLKYENELDKWKEAKLTGTRREGLQTETQSTAGAKQPQDVKVTRENLGKLLTEELNK